jgi:hypothetical protein
VSLRVEVTRGPTWLRRAALVGGILVLIPIALVAHILIGGLTSFYEEIRRVLTEARAAWRRAGERGRDHDEGEASDG